MSRSVRIDSFRGVDNKHAPESLVALGRDSSTSALTIGQNVNLSDDGHIFRRDGFTQVLSGDYHSVWGYGADCFAVRNQQLVRVTFTPSATYADLLPVGTLRMSFVRALTDTYFSNGQMIGVIGTDGVATPLNGFGDYEFPKQTLGRLDENVSMPLPGTELEFFSGRLLVGNEDAIWYSRPYLPKVFDIRMDYIPWKNATLLKGVTDGLYVGTADEVWFLAGLNPKQFSARRVCAVGAIKGTSLTAPAVIDGAGEDVVYWESPLGKVRGRSGGRVDYLTDERVSYATASEGASLVRNLNGFTQHISALPSQSGADAQNMRSTDIAVAEIRRNGVIIT